MKKEEILRLVDSIYRDKSIPKEVLFESLEFSMEQAAVKVYEVEPEDVKAEINRVTGEISVVVSGKSVGLDNSRLGRIAAQTAKQALAVKIREAERDMVVEEFSGRVRTLVTAEVLRRDKGNVVVAVHGFEAVIPKEEQVPTERYRPGDRMRCYILSVNASGSRASLVLSRARPELVHELFIADVPEVAENIIDVVELAREPGFRTKIAVHCEDPKIDSIGACVGPRGTRIRNIINELGGEKIDIIRWSDVPETFIANSLAPARISRVYVDRESKEALVVVPDDQLSLAIGRKGQNVRLTCRLTRWDVDVRSESEFDEERRKEGDDKKIGDALLSGSVVNSLDAEAKHEDGPESIVETQASVMSDEATDEEKDK
ncbi:MAG: transcription termination factor NusA [Planctomycetes bacterium]|nr:transcription termination factor NusA [Planctomycetota bacterium]